MLESLEQAFLRERQFTSDVSHELRTPVSVILAQCEASLNRTDLSEEQRKEILLIRKKGRRNVSDDLSSFCYCHGQIRGGSS